MRKAIGLITGVFSLLFVLLPLKTTPAKAQQLEDPVLQLMDSINAQLSAAGAGIRLEAVEFYTIGRGRPSVRIHQAGSRWVPNDIRRLADGENLTYLVDLSDGVATGGLAAADTDAAIERAVATWQAKAAKKLKIVKRTDTGLDPDIIDFFLGEGAFGIPEVADIVHAGWLSPAFFDKVAPPNGGSHILAVTFTLVFIDPTGNPTDINNDQYLDTSLKEVYYNNGFDWGIDGSAGKIDVETVALHESGHTFELGHFGPPPEAVMNESYFGVRRVLAPIDEAGLSSLFGNWPNK